MKRISNSIEKKLNDQAQHEWDNHRLYFRFSQCLDFNGWFGAAKLWKLYSDEELEHMEKIVEYLKNRDCNPDIQKLDALPCEFKGIKDIASLTYDREIDTSDRITDLSLSCLGEKDLSTYEFLTWFISEQISEEAKALYWMDRIKMMELNDVSLYHIDNEMKDNMNK
jgi:ferritin